MLTTSHASALPCQRPPLPAPSPANHVDVSALHEAGSGQQTLRADLPLVRGQAGQARLHGVQPGGPEPYRAQARRQAYAPGFFTGPCEGSGLEHECQRRLWGAQAPGSLACRFVGRSEISGCGGNECDRGLALMTRLSQMRWRAAACARRQARGPCGPSAAAPRAPSRRVWPCAQRT